MLTLLSAYAKKPSLRDLVMTDMPSDQELTQLLQRWSEGNQEARQQLRSMHIVDQYPWKISRYHNPIQLENAIGSIFIS
jgi:hypothetical protein